MAIDTTNKALDLATQLAQQSGALMDAVRAMVALKEEVERGGILFAPGGVAMSFADTALRHTDGDGINNVITSAVALKGWLDANFHSDNFDQARS
jgi:hypothetical protein